MLVQIDTTGHISAGEVKRYLEVNLDKLRKHNDGDMDAVKTAHTRGQIAFAKEMLRQLFNPAAPVSVPTHDYEP